MRLASLVANAFSSQFEWWHHPEDPNGKVRDYHHLKWHCLVTTYDTLIADFDVFEEIPFAGTVVDEAHRLRNQQGKLLKIMKRWE